jgi:hypothetical protein
MSEQGTDLQMPEKQYKAIADGRDCACVIGRFG